MILRHSDDPHLDTILLAGNPRWLHRFEARRKVGEDLSTILREMDRRGRRTATLTKVEGGWRVRLDIYEDLKPLTDIVSFHEALVAGVEWANAKPYFHNFLVCRSDLMEIK